MYPLIGVGLQRVPPLVLALRRTAEHALPIFPLVLNALEPDIPAGVAEPGNGVFAVGVLGAVQAPPGEQAGQLRDGDAKELLVENVVDALLQVGKFLRQPLDQPLGDLPQEHAGLAGRVQERGAAVVPEFFRQHIQHFVGNLWWSEHLVAAEIRQTGEDVRVIHGAVQITHSPAPSCSPSVETPGWGPG